MSTRYLCVHAHFYQPPREDPFTGEIPREPGAEPFHDYNEKINAESYRPNAEEGNLELISFNVGPTLIYWIERHDPETYRLIQRADRWNVEQFGVGNAIAQAYNHTILPLDRPRDKETQVIWGIRDFEYRFGRRPEGMWLPETAVDLATLEALVSHDIKFTILAPWQAKNAFLDTTEPYWVNLPSGRRIAVFFFDPQLSKHVSFSPQVTVNAGQFADLILPMRLQWHKEQTWQPQLLLIATDGELYGHHQKFRDLFLKDLVRNRAAQKGFDVVSLARYLRDFPPTREMEILEPTSWSCFHGVDRWRTSCGCVPGDQRWKAVLRGALDHLAEAVDHLCEDRSRGILQDFWRARNAYIDVVLGRRPVADLVQSEAVRTLTALEVRQMSLLLEAQCYRQWMYTSCAFFWDDLGRIEPRNAIGYAARAADLVRQATGVDLARDLGADLRPAVSASTGESGEQILNRMLELRVAGPASRA